MQARGGKYPDAGPLSGFRERGKGESNSEE